MPRIKDDDGVIVTEGCEVIFSYGIPPVVVVAPVIKRGRRLIALSPGHNPSECPVSELRSNVASFYVKRHQ